MTKIIIMKENKPKKFAVARTPGEKGAENREVEKKKKKAECIRMAVRKNEEQDRRADSRSQREKWLSCEGAAPPGK